MPEPISPAALPEPVTPTSVETPEITPSPEVSSQPEPQTETPLTPEQVAAIEKIADQRAFRIAQSQVAKGENRIQKLIQDKFAALDQTKGALGLSDEQVAQARQKIVADVYSATEEPPTSTPPPTEPSVDELIQFMNAQIKSVFDDIGTAVTKADPEFADLQKAVDASWNDPNGMTKIIRAADKAATAKAARLQKQNQNAAARVVGGGGPQSSGQAPQVKSAHDAWGQAYKKE